MGHPPPEAQIKLIQNNRKRGCDGLRGWAAIIVKNRSFLWHPVSVCDDILDLLSVWLARFSSTNVFIELTNIISHWGCLSTSVVLLCLVPNSLIEFLDFFIIIYGMQWKSSDSISVPIPITFNPNPNFQTRPNMLDRSFMIFLCDCRAKAYYISTVL